MKQKVKNILKHPLITGSSVVFIGSLIANLFNWIFSYSMGRWFLSASDFGLISSLNSIFALFALFPSALSGIFAKFSASYFAKDDKRELNGLIMNGGKITFLIGFVVYIFLIMLIPFSVSFLQIHDARLVFLIFSCIFIAILSSLPMGMLQGRMRFYLISFINGIGPVIKIIFGFTFIFLGLKVFGVVVGIFLSFLFPFLYALSFLFQYYDRTHKGSKRVSTILFFDEFRRYGFTFFLASLGIAIISNTDILLVRHFFVPKISGQYAALSLMGKAIFYLTAPIHFVFFPLIAYKKEKKERFLGTLLLAMGIIALFSASLSFVYFVFPHLVLAVFFPAKEYASLSPFLGPFSLFILIFSLATVLHTFFLSIGRTGIYKINLFVSFLLIFLVFVFHKSLYQIIGILFFVSFLLLLLLLIYYKRYERG